MNALLFNAGSSSLKSTLMRLETGEVLARGTCDWAGAEPHVEFAFGTAAPIQEQVESRGYGQAVDRFLKDLVASSAVSSLDEIHAVGHRIVHGGPFRSAVRITDAVRRQIGELIDLAPLHNPPSLETLAAAERALPQPPHIATFDTAFHATLRPEAYTYPVPAAWTEEWGIRRYGFHGLSHSYCSQRAAELLSRSPAELRIVSCHLGHGCSVAAIDGGLCRDTTMGYTPLEGLMMGTRSGSLDPGVLLHVQKVHGLSASDLETILNRQSGLLGVSRISGDMRSVLAAASAGDLPARLAIEVYVHRIRQAIGSMAASLGGIDALVFTAGVGEHSAPIRSAVCERLGFLGLQLAPDRNAAAHSDAVISERGSRAAILVVTCREDLSMLAEMRTVLRSSTESGVAASTENSTGK